ncbi:MAG: hypothetical protein BWY67_02046 [Bacteroidetes bacterium ADurb.Bin397]|nr:MAG: hypothetical protein BWY67_02046 [Bacteroidetes bacterium ADurb.Bin397]
MKGSRSLSSSCRNSLFARTTPARKVPRAGLNPTNCIKYATPTTSKSAEAVNISRKRVLETILNKGTTTYFPATTIAATAPITNKVCIHPG